MRYPDKQTGQDAGKIRVSDIGFKLIENLI